MEAARHPFPVSSTAPHYRRIKSESQGVSELSSEPLSGNATNRELASSPAQNEAFTTRTVDAAEALFLGKGQQLTGTPTVSKLARCRTSSVLIPAVRE